MKEHSVTPYDNVAGNLYDKYHSTNPIAKYLMNGFLSNFDELVAQTGAKKAFEVGCGEGQLTLRMERAGIRANGTDLEESVVMEAIENGKNAGVTSSFRSADLYGLSPQSDAAELVVCCEVLEHVPDPARALDVLISLAKPWLLLSVPREPVWCWMNMARGKYLSDWGNTPGHIQHWSAKSFKKLVETKTKIVAVRQPLPWTMVLCRCD